MKLIKFILIVLLSGCVKIPHYYTPADNQNTPRRVMPGNSNIGLTHIVKPNDTLDVIASQNNISYKDLAKWNKISPPYEIIIGQTLILHPPVDKANNIKRPGITPTILGARTPNLPQDGCEVSIARIKIFNHNSRKDNFCGWLSACVGASYIIKNNSAQARVIDIIYASNDEERVLHRALKIEGQGLFTGKVYGVDRVRNNWNIVVEDCFW